MDILKQGYTAREFIDSTERIGPEGDCVEAIDPKIMSMVTFFGKYVKRAQSEVLRAHLKKEKENYDNQGEEYKTPYPLKDIDDELERAVLIPSIFLFNISDGCSRGCNWCAVDCYPVRVEDMAFVPEKQIEHLFREALTIIFGNDCLHEGSYWPAPFPSGGDIMDYPWMVELIKFFNKYALTSEISTSLPKSSDRNVFKALIQTSGYIDILTLFQDSIRELEGIEVGSDQWVLKVCKIYDWYLFRFFPSFDYCLALEENLISEIKNVYRDRADSISGLPYAKVSVTKHPDNKDFVEQFEYRNPEKSEILSILRKFSVSEDDAEKIANLYTGNMESDGKVRDEMKFLDRHYVRTVLWEIFGHDGTNKELLEDLFRLWGECYENYYSYNFAVADRVDSEFKKLLGKPLFDSSSEGGKDFGIVFGNGMELTPYGIFNYVNGYATRDYPQGRIIVPYDGIGENAKLCSSGDSLLSLLSNVIVFRGAFEAFCTPDEFFVFDGLKRVRKISFDKTNYTVKSDVVVEEGVKSFGDVKKFYRREQK